MYIKTTEDVQTIFLPLTKHLTGRVSHHLIATTDKKCLEDLSSLKKETSDFCAIALFASHSSDTRMDCIFLVVKPEDIDSDFMNQINAYVSAKNCKILSFLDSRWKMDTNAFPLVFLWTTRTMEHFTLIADRAVSPAYRSKGIMKEVSLNLVEHLSAEYGKYHQLQSFPIHPATYLFFNPDDKNLKSYYENDLQILSCAILLKLHRKPAIPQFIFSPELLTALNQHSTFGTNNTVTSKNISTHQIDNSVITNLSIDL